MSTYRGIAALVLGLAGIFVTALECKAQVACYGQHEQLPAPTVADFIANPTQLLLPFSNGGPDITLSNVSGIGPGSTTTTTTTSVSPTHQRCW
jgi:hypothetical protein